MTRHRARPHFPAGVGGAGLMCIVVGTFLPWLYSGSRTRNSYAADGAVRRLIGVHGIGDAALAAWPFVSLACGAAVAAFVLGLPRIAAAIALLAAVGTATGAIAMLTASGSGVVRPANVGPIVTLAGALAVLAAASMQTLGATLRGRGRE